MKARSFVRKSTAIVAATIGVAFVQPTAQAIEFTISSIPGSEIVFTPLGGGVAAIDFVTTDPDGLSFQIDGVSGGTGSALGYLGGFLSGFEVGPAVTVSGPLPLIEVAPITGLGLFGIFDGVGGGIAFFGPPAEASSLYTPVASVAGFSFASVLPFLLDSTDPDLVEFFSGTDFSVSLAFSLTPGRTLADIIENGGKSSFSGVLTSTGSTVPDSGTTLGLLGLGLCGLWAVRQRSAK